MAWVTDLPRIEKEMKNTLGGFDGAGTFAITARCRATSGCLGDEEEELGGSLGPLADVLLCIGPIAYLVIVTLKPNPTPTTISLPISALMMLVVKLAYLGEDAEDALESMALTCSGMLQAITPISIVAGAIFLFESMEARGSPKPGIPAARSVPPLPFWPQSSLCLDWMRARLKTLSGGHPVAEVMLIGWAFAYLIEGASGFGTPAALASPMLVAMGHPPLETAVCLLLTNTFATVFGAVGTPVWCGADPWHTNPSCPPTDAPPATFRYGFGGSATEEQLLTIGLRASMGCCLAAFLLVPVIVCILVPFRMVRRSIVFVLLSIGLTSGTQVLVASVSYEFPSLAAGLVGLVGTAALTVMNIGLAPMEDVGPTGAALPPKSQTHLKESVTSVNTDDFEEDGVVEKIVERLSRTSEAESFRHSQGLPTTDAKSEAAVADTSVCAIVGRTMPLWLTIGLLIVTRIDQLGIKGLLRDTEPIFEACPSRPVRERVGWRLRISPDLPASR